MLKLLGRYLQKLKKTFENLLELVGNFENLLELVGDLVGSCMNVQELVGNLWELTYVELQRTTMNYRK